MEIQATQLHWQREQTRTAMTAKLDLLKQYVSQKVPAIVEQTVIAPVRSLRETTTKGTALFHQYPWLIIAGGALLGYYLRGAQTRPIRSAQSPPQPAIGASPTVPPTVARATSSATPSQDRVVRQTHAWMVRDAHERGVHCHRSVLRMPEVGLQARAILFEIS
jgi:hypothetical protein